MISIIQQNPIFFLYLGLAFLIALVAILWGTQGKILGACLLLASIPLANILFRLYRVGWLGPIEVPIALMIFDLALALFFLKLYRSSTRLERNLWASVLVPIQLITAFTDFWWYAHAASYHTVKFRVAINLLFLLALVICLIGFTPKSPREARDVLKMKWLYLKSTFFSFAASLSPKALREDHMARKTPPVSEIDAHIGEKIRQARITQDLSREDLAKLVGLSVTQIQKYESGVNRVSASALFELAKLLKVEMNFFTEGLEQAPETQKITR